MKKNLGQPVQIFTFVNTQIANGDVHKEAQPT